MSTGSRNKILPGGKLVEKIGKELRNPGIEHIHWVNPSNLVYKSVVMTEPSSKANSRRLIYVGKRPRFILSKNAQKYCEEWEVNSSVIVAPESPVTFDVAVVMKIYYATRRKDLDESLILDMLQGKAFVNDRQVKKKDITWGFDKEMPRSEIEVYGWQ